MLHLRATPQGRPSHVGWAQASAGTWPFSFLLCLSRCPHCLMRVIPSACPSKPPHPTCQPQSCFPENPSQHGGQRYVHPRANLDWLVKAAGAQAYLFYCAPQVFLFFLQTEGKTPTNKKITTHLIVILALLWWSGTEPAISLRSARTELRRLRGQVLVVMSAMGEEVGTGA